MYIHPLPNLSVCTYVCSEPCRHDGCMSTLVRCTYSVLTGDVLPGPRQQHGIGQITEAEHGGPIPHRQRQTIIHKVMGLACFLGPYTFVRATHDGHSPLLAPLLLKALSEKVCFFFFFFVLYCSLLIRVLHLASEHRPRSFCKRIIVHRCITTSQILPLLLWRVGIGSGWMATRIGHLLAAIERPTSQWNLEPKAQYA
jgi:hypothetical protein